MVREDNKAVGQTYLFTYDNFGNILSKRTTNYTVKTLEEIESYTEETEYSYDGRYPDRLVKFGAQSISYNDNGLPTNYLGKTLEWSAIGQLTKVGSTEYVYDGYGKRIKKGNTVFTYDFGNRLIKQGNKLEFYYDGNGLTGLKYDNVNYIYRKNAQGDITHILDMDGNIVVKYTYDVWGNHVALCLNKNEKGELVFSETSEPIEKFHSDCIKYKNLADANPFRYRSYYYDTDAEFYYLKSRYYDPTTGRFISQDEESYIDSESINGLNLYAYCLNNPVGFNDHEGNKPKWWEWLVNGLVLAVGVVLCATGIGTALGVSLLVAGGSMLASNVMSAAGVNGKVASIISSTLNIVAGIALCFTPFAAMGASMIGSGVGGIAGGFISEALGFRFETGAMIGSIVGGIIGGQVYKVYDAKKIADIAKHGSAVVGETMGRVTNKAQEIGAATFKNSKMAQWLYGNGKHGIGGFLSKIGSKLTMSENMTWIRRVCRSGVDIVNIGIDLGRSTGRSPFYIMELQSIFRYLQIG